MKRASLRLAAPLVLAASTTSLLVFASVGCGSGGGSAPVPTIINTAPVVAYLGRTYTGQVPLDNGQTGNVSLTVSTDNTASGTLEIVDPSRKTAAKSRLTIATPFLSGTFDPATGAINLTGSYLGANGQTIPISITGTLPAPPSTTGGSLTVTVNGQSYTTTFGGTGGGTTNPTPAPSPSGSATPNPTPSASPSASPAPTPSPNPASGAVQFTLISKTPDCNFSDPGISGWTVRSAGFSSVPGQLYQFSSVIQGADRNVGSFSVGWQRRKISTLVPETLTYLADPQIGPFGDDFQASLYTAIVAKTSAGGASVGVWRPNGGTLTIVSINGSKVTVRGDKVQFTGSPSPGTNGTGSFIADFTITYDSVEGL